MQRSTSRVHNLDLEEYATLTMTSKVITPFLQKKKKVITPQCAALFIDFHSKKEE
jgi:hypothetical protein